MGEPSFPDDDPGLPESKGDGFLESAGELE